MAAVGEFPPRICDAADFDSSGTNNMASDAGGLTGVVDGKTGIVSFWYQPLRNFNSIFRSILQSTNQHIGVGVSSILSNPRAPRVQMLNAAGTIILSMIPSASFNVLGQWYHVLAAWDLNTTTRMLFVDNVQVALGINIATNDTIDYTDGEVGCGKLGGTPNTNAMDGAMAEVWFAPNQFMDISIPYNRQKWRTPSGRPADLGTDGSKPTGTAPAVYFKLDDGQAVANFATNHGTGHDFTINGTLALTNGPGG